MVLKRPFHEEGVGGTRTGEAKRFKNAVRDVLGVLSINDFVSKMEPFLRTVVRDEVERTVARILQPSSRPFFDQASRSGKRGLLLQFVNKMHPTIFTCGKIEAEDGSPIKIMLLDANTKKLVTSGPQSCMKIEILVLDGDFGSDDDQDEWSENEFASSVIREREGRRPLIAGELNVVLRNGVGEIGDIYFTDNSSWQRSRKFRLGAKPIQKNCGVREARSQAFVVKDHRGELYKKHYPPSLGDEVWRLEKIAKDGAFHRRLASHGIHSVKEFLQLYVRDSSKLRHVLGGGISIRTWDTIIGHAITCVPNDGKFYTFYESSHQIGLLFDSIYQVVGASFDGQNYEPLDTLTPPQKGWVENIKRQAYQNVNDLQMLDTNFVPRPPLASLQAETINSHNLGLPQLLFPVTRQDQPEMLPDFNNSSSSTSYVYDADSSSQLEVSVGHNPQSMQVFPAALKNSFKFPDNYTLPHVGESSWSAGGTSSQWPIITTSGQLTGEVIPELQTSTWPPGNSTLGQGNNTIFFTSDNEGEYGIFSSLPSFSVNMSRIQKPKAAWCKLRAALKWGSVRRNVAAKRWWQSLCVDY